MLQKHYSTAKFDIAANCSKLQQIAADLVIICNAGLMLVVFWGEREC
jgi:hypothetical protein